MIALIQRVLEASVTVDGEIVGQIGPGLLALAAVERGDDERRAARLAERIVGYRVFEDAEGRMNRSLAEAGGGLLLVSQFTLAADTRKGARPSFTPAAGPESGRALFESLLAATRRLHRPVETGRFGARMRVALVNDGPVTFWLRINPEGGDTGIHSV
jgi:D-aminoacyl-tRNA deacylase